MIVAIDERRRPPVEGAEPLSDRRKAADPWADWQPQWTGQVCTPQDVQERHSPTRAVDSSYRRIVDARLWEAMTPAQQDAACDIAAAFEMMGRGLGYVVSNWQRIPGCRSATQASDVHARLIKSYVAWAERCARERVSHALVVDVLCFGFTCRALDRDRRMKNGSARDNLMRGLALYCNVRGWGR